MRNVPNSRDLSFFHPTERVWYVVQPSSFSGSNFMVVRFSENGYSTPTLIGSLKVCLNNLKKHKEGWSK